MKFVPNRPYDKIGNERGKAGYDYIIAVLTLDSLIEQVDIDLQPFAVCEARNNSHVDLGASNYALLHYVLAGEGEIISTDCSRIRIYSGTVIIIPAGIPHKIVGTGLSSKPVPYCNPLDENWEIHRAGTGKNGVVVVCGRIQAKFRGVHDIFTHLESPLVSEKADQNWLTTSLDHLLDELVNPRDGTRILTKNIMQECLVSMLRNHYGTEPIVYSWIASVNDSRLWKVVPFIYESPEAPHTLETLALRAGMSRSSFSSHFLNAMGCSPMQLIKLLRLKKAAALIRNSDFSLDKVARAVGYDSRSYFSRAFKQEYGQSPTLYRAEAE